MAEAPAPGCVPAAGGRCSRFVKISRMRWVLRQRQPPPEQPPQPSCVPMVCFLLQGAHVPHPPDPHWGGSGLCPGPPQSPSRMNPALPSHCLGGRQLVPHLRNELSGLCSPHCSLLRAHPPTPCCLSSHSSYKPEPGPCWPMLITSLGLFLR